MKRVLVTGAGGFIGRQTLPFLLSRGFEVHAVSSRDHPRKSQSETWHLVDLLDAQQIERLMANVAPSHLLHLAWIATAGAYLNSMDNIRWLQASLELSRQFVAHGGSRMVVAGTCAEYDWRYGYCSESLTPINPDSLYGASKASLSLALAGLADETHTKFAWGRIFFPYGPHQDSQRLVAFVIRSLLLGQPAKCSPGRQVLDYIFVSDVADALVELLDSDLTGSFNIGTGRGVAVSDVAKKIGEILECPELVHLGAFESKASDAPLVIGDIRELKERLGWSPKCELEDGLRLSVEWWREQLSQNRV